MKSAVAWSFLSTALRLGTGVFILPLILRQLPTEQYGLWVLFGTFGGLAWLLDFGFESSITRMTSYAWGGATRIIAFGVHEENSPEDASEPNRLLLGNLIATLKAYYLWVGLGGLGIYFFAASVWIWKVTQAMPEPSSARAAWLVYASGCALNFVSGRWPALLRGVGAVRESQHIGVISLLAYYVIAISGLFAGFGLWSLVVGWLGSGLAVRVLGKRIFCRIAALPNGLPSAHFHRDIFAAIWPNAWRMGLVSLGAFLIVQANTLICNAFLGLKTTASYGISFQLFTMLGGISSVWLTVKAPDFNQMRVQKRNGEILTLFTIRMRLTVLTYAAGALTILFLAPEVLSWMGSKTSLLPSEQLAFLALIQFLEMHHSQYAGLVLTENRNPFLKPALISGAAIAVSSVLLAPRFGVWGLLIPVGVVQACYNNWWPVLRALHGLNIAPADYFRNFFFGK